MKLSKRLFLRKSIKAELEEEGGGHQLRRHLSSLNLTSIGIGAIIGAGIFVITGQAAALYAGPGVVLSFIIAAIICLFAGLCYAELAALIPISGGSYSYSYVALGEFPAWIVGWTLIIEYLVSAATVSAGWAGYVTSLLRDFGITFSQKFVQAPLIYKPGYGWALSGGIVNLPAVLLLVAIGFFVSVGVKAAARLNSVMVVIKLSTILVFILVGVFFVQSENWTPFIPANTGVFGEFGWSGVLRGAGLVFFAYIGFDAVSTLAQEAVNPQKDLPTGILGSLGISTAAYIATSLVLTGVASYLLLNVPDPMAVALNAMGAAFFWLKLAIKIAIIAGLTSVVLVQLLGQARIFFAIGRDGLLPARFGKVHPRFRTPLFSSVTTATTSLILAGLLPINVLGELVSMATLFLFAIVCFGVLILRYTHPDSPRPFKVPLVPFVPLAGIVTCFAQMCFFPLVTWVQMVAWVLLGLVVYFCYGAKHSKLRKGAASRDF